MALTFKPKKQQIHVPGLGIVQKEDFNQKHFDILIKRAQDRDAFIKQHFVIDSYGDQELFVEAPAPIETPKGKVKKTVLVREKTDDEKLNDLIAEEDKKKSGQSEE